MIKQFAFAAFDVLTSTPLNIIFFYRIVFVSFFAPNCPEHMGPQAVIAVSLLLSVTHGGSIQFIFNELSYIITYTTII